MTTPIPADAAEAPPPFRERRKRRRRLHPALRSAIALGLLLLIVIAGEFAYHSYHTTPRDARAITERELRLTVLQPGEQVKHIVPVFRRSPLDYYRATRGVLVLTDRRLVYLGLLPRDLVASPDAPAAFEEREFPIDTTYDVHTGHSFLYLTKALVIDTPKRAFRLSVPSDAWPEAKALAGALEKRYAAIREEAKRQRAAQAATEQERRRAANEARAAQFHVVQRGEALATIARKYNVTPEYLQQLNHLPDTRIRVGQRLMVKPQT